MTDLVSVHSVPLPGPCYPGRLAALNAVCEALGTVPAPAGGPVVTAAVPVNKVLELSLAWKV